MASYTSFLNLEKPTTSERLDVLKINSNWDKIDAGVSSLNSQKANKNLFTNYVDITATTSASGSIALSNTTPSFGASAILTSAHISPDQSPTIDGIVILVRSYSGNWYAKVMNWDLTPMANTTVKIRVYGV